MEQRESLRLRHRRFSPFTAEDFKNIDPDGLRTYRDLLKERDVFVPKGRHILILDALYDIIKTDLPWPKKYKTITTGTDNGEKDNDGIEKEIHEIDATSKTILQNKDGSDESTTIFWRGNPSHMFKAYSSETEKYSGNTTETFAGR